MAGTETARFATTGMHCQSCAMLIQMNLEDLDGVTNAVSDFRTGVTEVTYDPEAVSVDDITGAIVAAGYGAELES